MSQHGKQEKASGRNFTGATNGPVFPGKPYQQENLAVQRGLMEIFDEFTDVISGELKSLNLEEFEQANRKPEA